jgi:hypothetical protein
VTIIETDATGMMKDDRVLTMTDLPSGTQTGSAAKMLSLTENGPISAR